MNDAKLDWKIMKRSSGPYRSIGAFTSCVVADTRGTTELDDHIGLTIHVSGSSRIERRRDGRTDSFSPQVASSFIDLPGNKIDVGVEGRAAVLQGKIPIERIRFIAAEDHDCVLKLDKLIIRQNFKDFDLLRLALCSRQTKQHWAVVERELVCRLVQLTDGKTVAWRGGLPPARLLRLHRLVSDRFLDITVNEMAESAGLTLYHFSREFKRATGIAPWAYVVQRKLEKAVDLLRLTNLAASDVASLSGFSHTSHLSRHMRARFGVTPAKLRRILRD